MTVLYILLNTCVITLCSNVPPIIILRAHPLANLYTFCACVTNNKLPTIIIIDGSRKKKNTFTFMGKIKFLTTNKQLDCKSVFIWLMLVKMYIYYKLQWPKRKLCKSEEYSLKN